jgi:hypothetical protein
MRTPLEPSGVGVCAVHRQPAVAYTRPVTDAPRELEPKEWAKWWKESGERELRQILFWRWDPIGVADEFPYTEDEYDGYATRVASLLHDEASPEAVADYLGTVERESMGLDEKRRADAHRREVVRFILEWYPESLSRWREFGPSRR